MMTTCYECSEEVPCLIWKSRCQACVDRRITFNRKCLANSVSIESSQEALAELNVIRVLRSNAGYYIGTEHFDEEMGCYVPYERLSGYYQTRHLAGIALGENSYYRL